MPGSFTGQRWGGVEEISQSILKEISPAYSLEGLMMKLKLQYFGHLMWWTDSFEKTLMLGKVEGRRRRGQQRTRWLDGITDSMDMSLSKPGVGDGQGSLVCCSPWGHKESDTTERLNWTDHHRATVFKTQTLLLGLPHSHFIHPFSWNYRVCLIVNW